MNNSPVLVSIVMPTWNSMRYLEDSLFSLFGQTHTHFELLVCDGGSTDGTLEHLESLNDPRIKIVSRQDTGLANSLNIGFSHAQGDVYCWLNSDDVYLRKDALANAASAVGIHGAGFAAGGAAMLSEDGQVQRLLLPWLTKPPFSYRGYSNFFTGGFFFNASNWKRFAGFSEKYKFAFEYELVDFLMRQGQPHRLLAGLPVAGFRLRPDSVSGANTLALFNERSQIFGHSVYDNAPLGDQLVRLYSYVAGGDLLRFIRYSRLNKRLPTHWRNLYAQ